MKKNILIVISICFLSFLFSNCNELSGIGDSTSIQSGIKGGFVFKNCQDFEPITQVTITGRDSEGVLYDKLVDLTTNNFEIEIPNGIYDIALRFQSYQAGTPPDCWWFGFDISHPNMEQQGVYVNELRFKDIVTTQVDF